MATDDTPLTKILREHIAEDGPISFERFMAEALYHPEHGYYCGGRDPFGKNGDFFTAAQLQPAYGTLIRAVLEKQPVERSLLDLGAGRGEMAEAFRGWHYSAVESGQSLPRNFSGVVFANELFDALPCRVFGNSGEALVDWRNERFVWTQQPRYEECSRAGAVLAEIARFQASGYLLIVDYGYDERERIRFPDGTLMSYRKHAASEDVLDSPGFRDITAHVNFTSIEKSAASLGFEKVKRTSLSSLLLSAGERTIEEAAAASPLQMKTLLFGMGEMFQALLLKRV